MLAAVKRFFVGGMAAARGRSPEMSNYALDASRVDDAWGVTPWPLRSNDEWDLSDLRITYQRARAMYHNSAPIRTAVEQMVRYIGALTPQPVTKDAEWNDLALAAWKRRTENPQTFDLAGRVDYRQAMAFCERNAIIDGDVCIVASFTSDGGAAFMFRCAPQVDGGGLYGVEADKHGKALAYFLMDEDGKPRRVPAGYSMLYQHNPDPTRLRGHTMLAPALRNASDVKTIVGLAKQGVKMSSSMGLVSTKAANSNAYDNFGQQDNKGSKKRSLAKREIGTGLDITFLPEGRDIKTISDSRPSTQLQAFFAFLLRLIAQGVTLDPEALYTSNELSSAATRLVLEKLRRFQEAMAEDQRVLANFFWRRVIACEIKEGRLPVCPDEAWATPRWVLDRDMTIDASRVHQAHINLCREGMADNEDFTLRTTGLTPLQLARRRARDLAAMKKIAEEYGLTLAELCPGQVGTIPQPAAPSEDEREEKSPAREGEAER